MVGLSYHVIIIRRAKRALRYSKCRLRLTEIATELQEYMLDGTLNNGEIIHDRIYQSIFHSQNFANFLTLRSFIGALRPSPADVESRVNALNSELRRKPENIRTLCGEYYRTYFRVMLNKSWMATVVLLVVCVWQTRQPKSVKETVAKVATFIPLNAAVPAPA
jgi:hypothetical protein